MEEEVLNMAGLENYPRLKQALASLRLEGVILSKESIDDLKLAEDGKLTQEEFTARILNRVKS